MGYAHHLPASGNRVFGIVHRDLSPDNILLSWDGAVKIADFSIAAAARRATSPYKGPTASARGFAVGGVSIAGIRTAVERELAAVTSTAGESPATAHLDPERATPAPVAK